jgi:hypothetical protein
MNDAVEVANKNVKKIIKKIIITYKDWHEILSFSLHVYRTVVGTSMVATLYSLAYGMQVIMPLEVEILSLRLLIDFELEEDE